MALRIVCRCGYVIRSEDDDEPWRNAQGHRACCTPSCGWPGHPRAGGAALAVGTVQQQPLVDGL